MAGSGQVERVVGATPDQVYDLVADITRTGEWGGECEAAEWLPSAPQGAVGSTFRGHNHVGRARWTRDCEVLVADRGREFAWRTIPGSLPTQRDSIRWSYRLTAVPGGTRVVLAHELLAPPLPWVAAVFRVVLPAEHHDVAGRTAATLDRLAALLAGEAPADAGCTTGDMVLVHRVFRREFGLLPAMVRAVAPGDTRRAARVVAHAAEMVVSLHHHHAGEDELVWPVLRARGALDPAAVDRLEAQHAGIAESLAAVEQLAPRWSRTAAPEAAAPLAAALSSLDARLSEHLADEEATMLPAAAKAMTQAEWDVLRARGEVALPKRRGIVFLAAILEEADAAEQAEFLRALPPPVRLLHRTVGSRLQVRERRRLRAGLSGAPAA